jgi:hypothetical protein
MVSKTLATNLEARGGTPRDEKPLYEELNNYSNHFPMNFPPWKKLGITRAIGGRWGCPKKLEQVFSSAHQAPAALPLGI